jgi:acyl phosphate:glycerol-3-phosphate acyltransferase
MMQGVVVILLAYLLGSIPFSYLVARRSGIDVRQVGSGNVGATNVMRSAGRTAGLTAFALDFFKGTAATLVAMRLAEGSFWPALAAMAAVLGHMYPVWLSFRGGKGVATGAGAFLPVSPAATGLALLIFGAVALVSRYASLGSVAGSLGLGLLSFALGVAPDVSWAALATGLLITWKHRGNLQRIFAGTERRMGSPWPAPGP